MKKIIECTLILALFVCCTAANAQEGKQAIKPLPAATGLTSTDNSNVVTEVKNPNHYAPAVTNVSVTTTVQTQTYDGPKPLPASVTAADPGKGEVKQDKTK